MARLREGVDYVTFLADPDDRRSGWSWCCIHCPTAGGWRWGRVDARRAARAHAADCVLREPVAIARDDATPAA